MGFLVTGSWTCRRWTSAGKLAYAVVDTKPCENWPLDWSSLWPRSNSSLQFGIVGFGSAISACSHVLAHRPGGQCSDVMPPLCESLYHKEFIPGSALATPLHYSKWISLKWKHYKTWKSKQALLLVSKVIHIYVSGFGIFAIECNIPICALGSSQLLNLIAGKLVILSQNYTSLWRQQKLLVEREYDLSDPSHVQGCWLVNHLHLNIGHFARGHT